jgi:hypothetical protein
MRNRSAAVLLTVLVGALLASCSPTPPPPPPGYELEVRTHGALLFGASRPEPPHSWEWGPGGISPVAAFALTNANDLSVGLRVPVAAADFSANQPPQVGILARDPVELDGTLDAITDATTGHATWLSETTGCALPDMVVLTTSPPINPSTNYGGVLHGLVTSSFGQSCSKFNGKAGSPSTSGSIKSLRTYNPGSCHQSIYHSTITGGIISGFKDLLAVQATGGGNCTDAYIDFADSIGTLSYNSSIGGDFADPNPNGGFSMAIAGHFDIHGPTPNIYANLNARYEYKLVDGRIGVDVASGFTNSSDGNVHNLLVKTVNTDLPQQIYDNFDQQMVAAPSNGEPPGSSPDSLTQCLVDSDCDALGMNFACFPSQVIQNGRTCQVLKFGGCDPTIPATGQPATTIKPIQPNDGTCGLAINGLLPAGIGDGAMVLLPNNPQQRQALQSALITTSQALDGSGNYRNWRCRRPTDGHADPSEHWRCEYRVDAVRFNVYPDKLDLVFWDHADTSNESYAFYVALLGAGAAGQLCGPLTEGSRSYSGTSQGQEQVHFAANKNVFSCFLGAGILQFLFAFPTLFHY